MNARRFAIVGTSGSGKTTLARTLSVLLAIEHIEVDSLYHERGWKNPTHEVFRGRLEARMNASPRGWVVCGNYPDSLKSLQCDRAESVVWLDYPRRIVMRRVILRTIRRLTLRTELWNGNKENFGSLIGKHSVVSWAWKTYKPYKLRYEELSIGSPHKWIRLCSQRDTNNFIATLRQQIAQDESPG